MKAFFVLIKIITVGLLWSVFFLEGVRVIMYQNWRFDILNIDHWIYARDLWLNGWVVNQAKEWAFVLILLTSIPLWLTGWAALCMIKYSKLFKNIFGFPFILVNGMLSNKTRKVANKIAAKTVVKRKSHKEIRPPAVDGSRAQKSSNDANKAPYQVPSGSSPSLPSAPKKSSSATNFDHSLFDFDDDDSFDFDIDTPVNKPAKKQQSSSQKDKKDNNKKPQNQPKTQNKEQTNQTPKNNVNSILEAIKEKGYDFLSSVTIKNTLVDFVALSQEKVILFLIDKENGDWLADEEKFNGEEPLWFSENSHRISPVRKISITKEIVEETLASGGFDQVVDAYVVNQMNNIINAEDMFEIWDDMDIKVTRIDRGTPKEIPLLTKVLPLAEERLLREDLEKIKKAIRGNN